MILSREEEQEVAKKKNEYFILFRDRLLTWPAAWDHIIKEWKKIIKRNRSVAKMAEEYGNMKYSAKDLAKNINFYLGKAEEDRDKKDFKNISRYISSANLSKSLYLDIKLDDPKTQEYLDKYFHYRDQLVHANVLLVNKLSRKFEIYGVTYEDIQQEGYVGLIKAADKFNYKRGLRFGTYAGWWIMESFVSLVKTQSKQIRLPSHIHNELTKIKRIKSQYESEYNKEPSHKVLAELVGISQDRLAELMKMRMDTISLEEDLETDKTGKKKRVKDIIEESVDYEEDILQSLSSDRIRKRIEEILTLEERTVLFLRFGFDEPILSVDQIVERTGFTKGTVNLLLADSMQKLSIELTEYAE